MSESAVLGTALDVILNRRSTARLTGPAPTAEQLEILYAAAATVPDHAGLRPWRLVVVGEADRDRFAAGLVAGVLEASPSAEGARTDKAKGKAYAAPMHIAIVASPVSGTKVPEWEQVASAACVGYAIVLAAYAVGLGAIWKSVPFTETAALRACFGVVEGEQLLGWIHLGQSTEVSLGERSSVDPAEFVTYLP